MKSTDLDSRSKRSFKNLISSVVKALLTAVVGFVVTPYIIRYIGDHSFGTYKLIIDWLSNVWIFDLGVSGAFVAIAANKLSSKKINVLFSAGLKTHLTVLPIILFACFIIYFFLFSLIDFSKISCFEYSLSFFLVALSYLFFPLNIFRIYFDIRQESSFVNVITLYQLILTNLLSLFLAYRGVGLVGICASYTLFNALFYFVMYYKSRKNEGWSLISLYKEPSQEEVFEINSTKKSSLLISISQKISFLGDNTIIAYFYSPLAVVPFFISQRLANLFQNQIQGIAFSGWASLIDVYRNEERSVFKKRLIEALKVTFFISLISAFVVTIFNKSFVYLWMSKDYFISDIFNLIIAILLIVNIQNLILGYILSGTGYIKKQSTPYIIAGVLNLILSVVFTYFYGMIGPVAASLLTMLVLFIYKLKISKEVFDLELIEFFKIYGTQIILFLIVSVSSQKVLLQLNISNSWMSLVALIIIFSLSYTILNFFICFNRDERSIWINRVLKIFR